MPISESHRLPPEERRALIVEAAEAVFAQHGYEGASTDTIAQAASVSQGHVIRLFGTKKELFAQVVAASLNKIQSALRAALTAIPSPIDQQTSGPDTTELILGREYLTSVAAHPSALLVLFRLISSGGNADLAELARVTIASLYRLLRDEARLSPADASRFLANGLLTSALVLTGMNGAHDADERELIEETVQGNLAAYTGLLARTAPVFTPARRSSITRH